MHTLFLSPKPVHVKYIQLFNDPVYKFHSIWIDSGSKSELMDVTESRLICISLKSAPILATTLLHSRRCGCAMCIALTPDVSIVKLSVIIHIRSRYIFTHLHSAASRMVFIVVTHANCPHAHSHSAHETVSGCSVQ